MSSSHAPIRSFVPEEFIYVVDHSPDWDTENLKEELRSRATAALERNNVSHDGELQLTNFLTFDRLEGHRRNEMGAFSLAFFQLPGLSDEDLLRLIVDEYRLDLEIAQLSDSEAASKRRARPVAHGAPATKPRQPADDEAPANGEDNRLWVVAGFSPNWLLNGTPHEDPGGPDMGGGGGPGTKPIPADIPDAFRQAALFGADGPWDFTVNDSLEVPPPVANLLERFGVDLEAVQVARSKLQDALAARDQPLAPGRRIKVIILDTAPPTLPQQLQTAAPTLSLQEAYQKWGQEHPILKSLIGNKVLTVMRDSQTGKPANPVELNALNISYYPPYDLDSDQDVYKGGFSLKRARKAIPDKHGHEYAHLAVDHGTFIAGIIHTLAPEVDIHLVEVLNAYAYGSLKAIAEQFASALQQTDPDDIILVNMSLMFEFPRTRGHFFAHPQHDLDLDALTKEERKLLKELLAEHPDFALSMALPLQYLVDLLSIAETIGDVDHRRGAVFAAAGNDGSGTGPRPKARFPAAFDNVTGVAALDDHQQYSQYTNQGDDPLWAGMATFGGRADSGNKAGWADQDGGMLGLYIGNFPDLERRNQNGNGTPSSTGWGKWAGTSFATPVIVGFLAQLLAYDPSLTLNEAMEIIRDAFWEGIAVSEERLAVQQNHTLP